VTAAEGGGVATAATGDVATAATAAGVAAAGVAGVPPPAPLALNCTVPLLPETVVMESCTSAVIEQTRKTPVEIQRVASSTEVLRCA